MGLATEREMELRAEKEDLACRLEQADKENRELRDRINELECILAKDKEERKCLAEAWKEGIRQAEILNAQIEIVKLIFGKNP